MLTCTCTCVQIPEVDVGSPSLSTLSFETGSLADCGACYLSSSDWQTSPRDPSASSGITLFLDFSHDWQIKHSSSYAHTTGISLPSSRPQPQELTFLSRLNNEAGMHTCNLSAFQFLPHYGRMLLSHEQGPSFDSQHQKIKQNLTQCLPLRYFITVNTEAQNKWLCSGYSGSQMAKATFKQKLVFRIFFL